MKNIKIAIIGCDYRLESYICYIKENGLIAVAIYDEEKTNLSKMLSAKYNIPLFTENYDSFLIKQSSDVIITLGSPTEYPINARKALALGKHIILNNVIGTNPIECDELFLIHKDIPKSLAIVLNPLRSSPAFLKARKFLVGNPDDTVIFVECRIKSSGLIVDKGDSWMFDSNSGGGILYHLVSYFVDVLTFMLGEECVSVHAIIKNLNPTPFTDCKFLTSTADDYVSLSMKFKDDNLYANIIAMSGDDFPELKYKIKIITRQSIVSINNGNFFIRTKKKSSCISRSSLILSNPIDVLKDLNSEENIFSLVEYENPKGFLGISLFFSQLEYLLTDENSVNLSVLNRYQSLKEAMHVKMVIEAAVESNYERCWICLASHVQRIEREKTERFKAYERQLIEYEKKNSLILFNEKDSQFKKF